MDKRRSILAILIAVVVVMSGAIVVVAVNNDRSNNGMLGTFTDALGREVNVTATPRTIVSMAPSITEMVYDLGFGGKLVGVTTKCDYPSEVTSRVENGTLGTVGSFYEPDASKIIALQPDIVLMDSSVKKQKDALPLLLGQNLTVVALYKGVNITEVCSNIDLAGKVLGDRAKAEQLISDICDRQREIANVTQAQAVHQKVLFVIGLTSLRTVGSGTYIDDIINVSGGANVFGDEEGYPSPTMEKVLMKQPEVLMISAGMAKLDPQGLIDQLSNDPTWAMTPAVQHGEIYVFYGQSENCFFRQGVRIVDGMQLLAQILYPEVFGVQMPHVLGNGYEQYFTP